MPYKDDGSDVPSHVKGKKKRRQWAHVWNSTYQSTGDESRAFASANSVTSKKVAEILSMLKKNIDENFPDTGTYDEDQEAEMREELVIWGDYAEDGPSFDPDGKYLCGTCEMRFGDDDCTHVVAPISFETGSCRIYIRGDVESTEALPIRLTQIEAAYTERPNVKGFGCARCQYGAKAKVPDTQARPSWCSFWGVHVLPEACCFKNTGSDDVFAPIEGQAKELERTMQTAKSVGRSEDLSIFCPFVKVDAAKREVWGVVTAEEPDKEGEICDYETTIPYYKAVVSEMSKATDGENIFPLRAMHGLIAAGKGIGIDFRDAAKEVYMGFKVVDDDEWKKVEENVYTGFSQGGRYIKKWKDGEYVRYTAKPGEVSLVDMPCLTRAHFDYVKTDGTTEVRKFTKASPPEVPQKETKFLVKDKDGKNYLPYTNDDGKINTKFMLNAWLALNSERGQKYDGPDKPGALKRLKQEYAKAGLDNPAEKIERIEPLVKSFLEEVIQDRAYGQVGKGMYTVSRFAQIVEDIKYLWMSLEYEREQEGDESPATDDLKAVFTQLLDSFLSYTEEQVEELAAHAAAFTGGMAMATQPADLLKAARQSLASHFKKAAAHHEGMAADHEACSVAHKAHSDYHEVSMGKAEDPQHAYHKASSSFHKAMSGHHSKLHKRHAAYAGHLNKMAEAHASDDTKKILELSGLEPETEPGAPMTTEVQKTDPTPQPATNAPAAAAPAAAAPAAAAPVAALQPAPAILSLDKVLDERLGKAMEAAFDRVLNSADFNKQMDERLSAKLLEKFGNQVAPTSVASIPVPRTQGTQQPQGPMSPSPVLKVDASSVDPQFADLVSMEQG